MTKTALILEDSKTQAQIIAAMIERLGWTPLHCETMREATDALAAMRVQALFLDIFVGAFNTLLHVERFRALAPETPLILMTAGTGREAIEDTMRSARRTGADYVLRKPFSESLLKDIFDSASPDIEGGARRRHVLVIDDSATIRTFAQRALEPAGYRVSLAASMEEAFANVSIAHVDLVVCDVFMPGMGGFKGMRTIKTTWPKVWVISMSAGLDNQISDQDALNATRKIGVDGQLKKPFLPEDLVTLATTLLDAA